MAKGKSVKASKGKSGKPPRPTAEELSDQQRQTLLFQHRRKIKPLLMAKKNADAALAKAFELAKKEGITRKEVELALKFETDEGAEKIKAEVERTMRIARWVGSKIGEQLDMFPKASAAEAAYEDGRRCALDDQPCKPPAHLSQAASQQWIAGHGAGRTQLNERRLSGFQSLGEAAKAVAPNGNGHGEDEASDDAAPPIGTEPPTHVAAH